jgi:DNA-binding MarR family transcriptional regulator
MGRYVRIHRQCPLRGPSSDVRTGVDNRFHGNYYAFHGKHYLKSTVPRPAALPSSSTLERHLGYWLRLVSNHVSENFARAMREHNLSVAEWVALNLIEIGADMMPAELADAMGMTRGAISKVLDKMKAKQWIVRRTSEKDNRVQLLSLTRRGRHILPELIAIADDNDARFFDALNTDEEAMLRKLLCKLAAVHRIKSTPVR